MRLVLWGSRTARKGEFTADQRVWGSIAVIRALESVGVDFEMENIDAVRNLESPCIFVCNHMSTLETFALSSVIETHREITFVIKTSLTKYPIFKNIMLSRDPVVVSRENPREDFEAILKGGKDRLSRGISIIIFPQTTRSVDFDPKEFNSIGVKLARRAGVPVIPVALKTDAWGTTDRFVKDFGRIDPKKTVKIYFGDPVYVQGNGKNEHETMVRFIADKLQMWQ